jgi:hypothetical protein
MPQSAKKCLRLRLRLARNTISDIQEDHMLCSSVSRKISMNNNVSYLCIKIWCQAEKLTDEYRS